MEKQNGIIEEVNKVSSAQRQQEAETEMTQLVKSRALAKSQLPDMPAENAEEEDEDVIEEQLCEDYRHSEALARMSVTAFNKGREEYGGDTKRTLEMIHKKKIIFDKSCSYTTGIILAGIFNF